MITVVGTTTAASKRMNKALKVTSAFA